MMKYGLNKSEEDLMFKYLDQARCCRNTGRLDGDSNGSANCKL